MLKNSDNNDEKNTIFLLCAISFYDQGITWYALEQQFIRWDLKVSKFSKGESYSILNSLDLVDRCYDLSTNMAKMTINTAGKKYLTDRTIDIDIMKDKVFCMNDIKSELSQIEEKIYGDSD
jgi:hypothetical protein